MIQREAGLSRYGESGMVLEEGTRIDNVESGWAEGGTQRKDKRKIQIIQQLAGTQERQRHCDEGKEQERSTGGDTRGILELL